MNNIQVLNKFESGFEQIFLNYVPTIIPAINNQNFMNEILFRSEKGITDLRNFISFCTVYFTVKHTFLQFKIYYVQSSNLQKYCIKDLTDIILKFL